MGKSGASFEQALMQVGARVPRAARVTASVAGHTLPALALTALAFATSPATAAQAEQATAAAPASTSATPSVQAFNDLISNNCNKCHNATDWAGSLAFDTLDVAHPGAEPEVWEKAILKLRGRLMPPAGEKQPGQA